MYSSTDATSLTPEQLVFERLRTVRVIDPTPANTLKTIEGATTDPAVRGP